MKEIEIFYLASCPYCINARKAVAELCEENPAYASLKLIWIVCIMSQVILKVLGYILNLVVGFIKAL